MARSSVFSMDEFNALVDASLSMAAQPDLQLTFSIPKGEGHRTPYPRSRSRSQSRLGLPSTFRYPNLSPADNTSSPSEDVTQSFLDVSRESISPPSRPSAITTRPSTPMFSSFFGSISGSSSSSSAAHAPPSPPRKFSLASFISPPTPASSISPLASPMYNNPRNPPSVPSRHTSNASKADPASDTLPAVSYNTKSDLMPPPPVPVMKDRRGSSSSAVPRASLSERLRSLPFSVSKLSLPLQRSPKRASGVDSQIPPVPSLQAAQLLGAALRRRASQESNVSSVRASSSAPRRSTSTPMLRMLARTSAYEVTSGSTSPEEPDPARISRVLTPDEDPFAKADVVAVDFINPFAPSMSASTSSLAIGRSQSPLIPRTRDHTARPLQLRIDAPVDPLHHPDDMGSAVSPAPTAISFASNDAYTPNSPTHSSLGHSAPSSISPLPSPSCPLSSFVFSSRSPKRKHNKMSPRTQQARHKDLPPTSAADDTPREKKMSLGTVLRKGPRFVPPSPPRRGSAPIVSVGGFPVPQRRLEAPSTKDRGGSVANISPAKICGTDASLAPPAVEDGRRPRFRDRLGSAFKFGGTPRPRSTASSSSGQSGSSFGTRAEPLDNAVSSAPNGAPAPPTLFPFVNYSGYITPAPTSPAAVNESDTECRETPVPPADPSRPVVRVSSLRAPAADLSALGIRSLRPPPSDQRRSRSLSPHPPSERLSVQVPKPASLASEHPTSPSLSACGGTLHTPVTPTFRSITPTAPSTSTMLDAPTRIYLDENSEFPPRTRKGSFPFEMARQRSLGDLDLMFTPRTMARESFIAFDDSGETIEDDDWLFGERESWERASVRLSVVSETSVCDMTSEDGQDETDANEGTDSVLADDSLGAVEVAHINSHPARSSPHLDTSWHSDPNSSLISSTSSLGLTFTDPWFNTRAQSSGKDDVTIASSEGTEESVDRWPLPPKMAVVIGDDGTAWTEVESRMEYFSPEARLHGARHEVHLAPPKSSTRDRPESMGSTSTVSPTATPALTVGELSPTLTDSDIDTPSLTFDAWGVAPLGRHGLERSSTVRSYLNGSQATELARRFAPSSVIHDPCDEEDMHPVIAPLRFRKRQSVASAYFSARSRPSTAGSTMTMDEPLSPRAATRSSPNRVSKIEEEIDPEDSGVFVGEVSMASL